MSSMIIRIITGISMTISLIFHVYMASLWMLPEKYTKSTPGRGTSKSDRCVNYSKLANNDARPRRRMIAVDEKAKGEDLLPDTKYLSFDNKQTLQRAVNLYLSGSDQEIQNLTTHFGPINDWDVSLINDFSHLFENATFLSPDRLADNNCELTSWDVSLARNMSSMFQNASSNFLCMINTDWDHWDVSNVVDFSHMFRGTMFDFEMIDHDVFPLNEILSYHNNDHIDRYRYNPNVFNHVVYIRNSLNGNYMDDDDENDGRPDPIEEPVILADDKVQMDDDFTEDYDVHIIAEYDMENENKFEADDDDHLFWGTKKKNDKKIADSK